MFCTKCGKDLRDGAKFCDVCGAPVNEMPQQTTQEPVPTSPQIQQSEIQISKGAAARKVIQLVLNLIIIVMTFLPIISISGIMQPNESYSIISLDKYYETYCVIDRSGEVISTSHRYYSHYRENAMIKARTLRGWALLAAGTNVAALIYYMFRFSRPPVLSKKTGKMNQDCVKYCSLFTVFNALTTLIVTIIAFNTGHFGNYTEASTTFFPIFSTVLAGTNFILNITIK